jgi:hypothetical protein
VIHGKRALVSGHKDVERSLALLVRFSDICALSRQILDVRGYNTGGRGVQGCVAVLEARIVHVRPGPQEKLEPRDDEI